MPSAPASEVGYGTVIEDNGYEADSLFGSNSYGSSGSGGYQHHHQMGDENVYRPVAGKQYT